MYKRTLAERIVLESQDYPVLAIVGPRQTGKTTLARALFPQFTYVLLEELEVQRLAQEDPRGFFRRYSGSLILDEVQKTPEILSAIQAIVDTPGNQRKFLLTGSEHLLLSQKISQTLAGRVRLYTLLPLSNQELPAVDLVDRMLVGGYPRIHDQQLDSITWLGQYYSTYVERDVRNVLQVSDLDRFDRLVRLLAGRSGQLLDFASLGNDAGVSAPTVKAWLSALKATFICFSLEPHHKNFNKRLIKSPKIYFFDTGLLCYLLRIKTRTELESHPLYGNIFETWVISERLKRLFHNGEESNLYFWRDQKGHEVDLVADQAGVLFPTEIKSAETFHPSFTDNLNFLNQLQKRPGGEIIYGGADTFDFKDFHVRSWKEV